MLFFASYFISPEVIRGEARTALLIQKSDVWSIGCTVFQMTCGKAPWQDQLGTAPFYYLVGRIGPEDEVSIRQRKTSFLHFSISPFLPFYSTPPAPCDTLYAVPMIIGC